MSTTPPSAAAAGAPRPPFPVVTATLVALNVAVFLWLVARGMPMMDPSAEQLFAAGGDLAPFTLTGDWWRLGTSMFIHAGLLHLALNMYVLAFTGWRAELEFGRTRMAAIYLGGGLLASCASIAWADLNAAGTNLFGETVYNVRVSVGASGAVMALFGAMLAGVVLPAADIAGPPRERIDTGLLKVIGLNLALGFFVQGVDQAAHVGGLAGGFVLGLLFA